MINTLNAFSSDILKLVEWFPGYNGSNRVSLLLLRFFAFVSSIKLLGTICEQFRQVKRVRLGQSSRNLNHIGLT